jgi:PKD repeat protein
MGNESGRREFMYATSSTAITASLLAGTGTVGASTAPTEFARGSETASGYIVEDADGRRRHVRPGDPKTDFQTTSSFRSEDGTIVSVTAVQPGASFSPDATVDVWVGMHDASGDIADPLADESLAIWIERPDGQEETFDVITGENGNFRLNYNLSFSGRGTGSYTIRVEHESIEGEATERFVVGTGLDLTTRTYTPAPVGEELTYAVAARSGDAPVSDLELDMTVTGGSEPVEKSTRTDADGFATVSFTPQGTGNYAVSAEAVDGVGSTSGQVSVVDVVAGSTLTLRHGLSGGESVYGGYLWDADGFVSNTSLTLQFREEYPNDDLVLEKQVTTDENGFFLVEVDLPSDVENDLRIEGSLADGRELALAVDRLRVSELDDGGDSSPVSVTASFSEWQYAPGTEAEIELEADDGGDPIADTDVDIFLRYGYDGPPAVSTTATTGSDGTATTTVSIPESAPEGIRLTGDATMEYDGTRYTSSLSADIEEYDISLDVSATPGEESEFSIEVSDVGTGDPAAGVPLLYDAQHSRGKAGSFGTGSLESGADGTDVSTVSIPNDVQFQEYVNYRTRYTGNVYRWLEPEFPGTLSGIPDTVAAGDTIDVSFTTPDGSTASGIVFADTGSPRVTIGTTVSSDGSGSMTIPEHAAGDWLSFRLWAADGSGQLYSDQVSVDVADEAVTKAAFEASATTAAPDEEITFDASASTAGTGSLSYSWDFGDGTTGDGEQVTHAYDDAGTYSVTLSVTDGAGTTDTATATVTVEGSGGGSPTVDDYAIDGEFTSRSVFNAISDWRNDEADPSVVFGVVDAWRGS